RATVSIPDSGSPTGNLRISGISFPLAEGADLPEWFLANKWHQLIRVAYAPDLAPGGAGSCAPGSDCLELESANPEGVADDLDAIVIASGPVLPSLGQNRAELPVSLSNYFEEENADVAPLVFRRRDASGDFNDQISSVCPDPYNANCP